jgi:hypothetical protein
MIAEPMYAILSTKSGQRDLFLANRGLGIAIFSAVLRKWAGPLFVLFIIAGLVPVLWFPVFPTADGPGHVASASLVRDYYLSRNFTAGAFLEPNPVVAPYWITQAIIAVALDFVSPMWAEKLCVGGYVLLLPFALRYALRSVSGNTSHIEFLILPFVFNQHLHWGFYNFCYGLALFCVGAGYWLRYRDNMSHSRTLTLAILLVLLYISHAIALFELLLLIAITALYERRLKWSAAAATLPALGLYAWYALHRLHRGSNVVEWPSLWYAASHLLKLAPIQTYWPLEQTLGIGIALLLGTTLIWGLRNSVTRKEWRGTSLLAFVATAAAAVFLLPVTTNDGTMLTPRFVYFPAVGVLLWMAAQAWRGAWPLVFVLSGALIAITLQMLHLPVYGQYQSRVQEILSVGREIPDGATMVFFTPENTFPHVFDPVTHRYGISPHLAGYLAAEKSLVLMNNFEAYTDLLPFVMNARSGVLEHAPEYVLAWRIGKEEFSEKYLPGFAHGRRFRQLRVKGDVSLFQSIGDGSR